MSSMKLMYNRIKLVIYCVTLISGDGRERPSLRGGRPLIGFASTETSSMKSFANQICVRRHCVLN